MEYNCKECGEHFESFQAKANHVRWNHRAAFSSEGLKSLKNKNSQRAFDKMGAFKEFDVKCSKCQTIFSVREREKLFPRKERYFCCRSCANSRIHSKDTKKKIGSKLKKIKILKKRKCQNVNCSNIIESFRSRKFCCKKCSYSIDLRKKFSEIAKNRFIQNPSQHPNRLCAGKKSFWQNVLYKELLKTNSNLQNEQKFDGYWMDIVDYNKKLNIEYDGVFFHKNRKDEDSKRDENLKLKGWNILRISSNDVKKGKNISNALDICNKFLMGS